MKFDDMNDLQKRLHNAAIVIEIELNGYGFKELLLETIEELEKVKSSAKGIPHFSDIPGCAVCDPCFGL